MDIFQIGTDVVANKFTALFGAVLIILFVSRHLFKNVQERREGLEQRVRFLEEQVLWMAETETDCVGLSNSAIALLAATGSGGQRQASDKQIAKVAEASAQLRDRIRERHDQLRRHFADKRVLVR